MRTAEALIKSNLSKDAIPTEEDLVMPIGYEEDIGHLYC